MKLTVIIMTLMMKKVIGEEVEMSAGWKIVDKSKLKISQSCTRCIVSIKITRLRSLVEMLVITMIFVM